MKRWCALFIPELWLQWCVQHSATSSTSSDHPAVVVFERDSDAGIVNLNRAAFDAGLRKGMSVALARSSAGCAELEVHHCDKNKRREVGAQIAKTLEMWTPWVEISAAYPGVFLIDPRGMDDFWGSHHAWLEHIRMGLKYALGLCGSRGVIGWSRESVSILVRLHREDLEFASKEEERALLSRVPLIRAKWLPASTRQGFRDVGLETVADLLRLDEASVRERLGQEAAALHRALSRTGAGQSPLQPHRELGPISTRDELEWQIGRAENCKRAIARVLKTLEQEARARREELLEVSIRLENRDGVGVTLEARASRATNSLAYWERVLMQKLRSARFEHAIEVLEAHAVTARRAASARLLASTARDLDAGEDVLAQLRATFGERSVCVASIDASPFPEEQTSLRRPGKLREPSPRRRRDPRWQPWVRVVSTRPPLTRQAPHRSSDIHDVSDPWRGIWRRYYQERAVAGAAPRWVVEDRKRGVFWHLGFA